MNHDLWRAVDHEGEVLEIFVTRRRNKKAANKAAKKAANKAANKAALSVPRNSLKRHGQTEIIVTDRLASSGAALREIGAIDERKTGRWLNNRADNSHQPFR